MSIGTTSDAIMNKSELVKQAFTLIGIDNPSPERIKTTHILLNTLMRELDKDVNFLWAITANPSAITLLANIASYTSSNGLPTDILRLESAKFRDSDGVDDLVNILTLPSYSEIPDKYEQSDHVSNIYLPEDRSLSNKTLFVHPVLSEVETQSELIGTDTNNYKCIRNHTGHADKRPITGDDWRIYWEAGGSSGVAYVVNTEYVAPELLLLWYRRPLFDFDTFEDDPDVPLGWDKLLLLKLAHMLSFSATAYNPIDRSQLEKEIKKAENYLKPSKVPVTDKIYNHGFYF